MKELILVTGGTGFIGSHTVVELQQSGYNVVIVDNLSNSNAQVLDGIFNITGIAPAFENVDCLDLEALNGVFTKYGSIKAVIHFAARKAVNASVTNLLSLSESKLTASEADGINHTKFPCVSVFFP